MDGISLSIIIGFLVVVQATLAEKVKRQKLLEWAIPRAIEIAELQGWVSSNQLMMRADLKKTYARLALTEACRQGHLYQAVDGRFYIKEVYVNSDSYSNIIPKAA
ncbi:MAG TPA: hypothetical protein VLZ74_07670 [Methylocella sp.]|nr:hypothetical protein [Methylocella sp.]